MDDRTEFVYECFEAGLDQIELGLASLFRADDMGTVKGQRVTEGVIVQGRLMYFALDFLFKDGDFALVASCHVEREWADREAPKLKEIDEGFACEVRRGRSV